MTGNQINYQRFLEDQRHNYVIEAHQARQIAEIERHNVVQESQGWKSLLETERHNRAGESLGWANHYESVRSNKAREALGWSTLSETVRSNKARESLGWAQHYETQRHNLAGEAFNMSQLNELSRHNREGEQVQWFNAMTGRTQVGLNYQIGMKNAETAYLKYLEDHRHNWANESMGYSQNPLGLIFNTDWVDNARSMPFENGWNRLNDLWQGFSGVWDRLFGN